MDTFLAIMAMIAGSLLIIISGAVILTNIDYNRITNLSFVIFDWIFNHPVLGLVFGLAIILLAIKLS